MSARVFGELPGIPPGTLFEDRRHLHDSSVHRPLQAGISGAAAEGADSIVVSGGYEDDLDTGDVLVYTGHGGNDPSSGKQVADQEFAAGNAALVVSQQRGYPIRVIRGYGGDPNYSPQAGYRYDGLYDVTRHWDEIGSSGHRVIRFELVRRGGQPKGAWANGEQVMAKTGVKEESALTRNQEKVLRGIEDHKADVSAAFELVLETTAAVAGDVKAQAQTAIGVARYDAARALLDLAERLSAFTARIQQASDEWQLLGTALVGEAPRRSRSTERSAAKSVRGKSSSKKRADYGKVAPGDKTSQREYLVPILEVLAELGGAATASDVLDNIAARMGPHFKPADLEPLASNPKEPRWRNTAQWARQQLVTQGFVERSRERGVWEISAAGREYLRQQKARSG